MDEAHPLDKMADLGSVLATVFSLTGSELHPRTGAMIEEIRRAVAKTHADFNVEHIFAGLCASYYHLDRIRELERQLADIAHTQFQVSEGEIPTGIPLTITIPKLGFEYQAFLFALRRTLEYLAVATADYFGRQGHRIKRLARTIDGAEPTQKSEKVRRRLQRLEVDLAPILSSAEEMAPRDRAAHWEALDAGVFRITWDKDGMPSMVISGGGEGLSPTPLSVRDLVLTKRLDEQLLAVEDLIFGIATDIGIPLSGQYREK